MTCIPKYMLDKNKNLR